MPVHLSVGDFPTLLVTGAAAIAVLCVALGHRSCVWRGPMVAVAATCVGLAMVEASAWWWVSHEMSKPRSTAPTEPRIPGGIILPPSILPSTDRMPGVRGPHPRVLFIGDSFTEGLGVGREDTFPSLVGQALGVDVVNHGVTGTDTREQHLLWHYYSRSWEPDVAVWVFVLNDFFPQIPLGPDYLMRYEPGPALGSYLLGMVRVTLARHAVQAETIEGYQRSLDPAANPEWFARLDGALREVHADVTRRGGRLMFVIFPLMWDLQHYPFAAGHAQVAAAAASTGAEVVDLLPEFRYEEAADLWVSSFDHHPNERGHALAARRLAETLRAGPLVVTPAQEPPPRPAQWLGAARDLSANDGANVQDIRVAMILATAAARLAELEGGPDGDAASEDALSFALHCRDTMAHWRPPPRLEPQPSTPKH